VQLLVSAEAEAVGIVSPTAWKLVFHETPLRDVYDSGNWSGHGCAGSQGRPSASMTRAWKKCLPCLAAVVR
jgi:hypothetical protein